MPYRPVERPLGEETWFCHYTSQEDKPYNDKIKKPISQIANLNTEIEQNISHPDLDKKKFIRGQIRDTDSKYIKLAKSGGHKNLLQYKECHNKTQKPASYSVVEWYYDNQPDNDDKGSKEDSKQEKAVKLYQRPEWMTYADCECNRTHSARRVFERSIIGFDNMSMWERKETEKQVAKEKLRKKKEPKNRKMQNKQKEESIPTKKKLKLPDISKRQLPGNSRFSRSNYAERWYRKWYL